MIVSVENGDCGTLFDAHGDEVDEHVVRADLDTGTCTILVRDENGHYVLTTDGTAVRLQQIVRPAPLRFERSKQ